MHADLILICPNICSLDSECPAPEAVAVKDGAILFTGKRSEVEPFRSPETVEIALPENATVLPGLKDSHMHLAQTGGQMNLVDCSDVRSIPEFVSRFQEYSAQRGIKPGNWLVGSGWNQNLMEERRFPHRKDFDEAFPDTPIFATRVCGHVGVVNSAALRVLGIDENTPDPKDGKLQRDPDGKLTGMLLEGAVSLAMGPMFGEREKHLKSWIETATERALEAGLTEVHTDDLRAASSVSHLLKTYEELEREGKLPLRIELELRFDSLISLREFLDRRGELSYSGNNVKIGNIKILFDGSLGARTAALQEEYSDAPGEHGLLNNSEEEIRQMTELAHNAGLPVAIHAIGDRAAKIAADAIVAAMDKNPNPEIRHRIVHLQLADEATYEKIAKYGIIGDIQPRFVATDWPIVDVRFGPDRSRWSYIWKTLLKMGVPLAGGSDAPVEPFDPLLGIHAALTRVDDSGNPSGGWHPEERLSAEEALSLFTTGVAYAASAEDRRGKIAPGYRADFTVVEGDYRSDPLGTAKRNRVLMTIIEGNVVFRRV